MTNYRTKEETMTTTTPKSTNRLTGAVDAESCFGRWVACPSINQIE
jgi:hypothetical protein